MPPSTNHESTRPANNQPQSVLRLQQRQKIQTLLRGRIAPAYLELRYEDAVGDFEASFRRVFDLLGLDWPPEVARFHQHAAGRFVSTPGFSAVARPLYRSAVARWRGYAEHFEPIRPLLQPYIDAFGYD